MEPSMLTLHPANLTTSELTRVARAELVRGEPLPVEWQFALVDQCEKLVDRYQLLPEPELKLQDQMS